MTALLIRQTKRDGMRVTELSRGDLQTVETALGWKRDGTWRRAKSWVHNQVQRRKPPRHGRRVWGIFR